MLIKAEGGEKHLRVTKGIQGVVRKSRWQLALASPKLLKQRPQPRTVAISYCTGIMSGTKSSDWPCLAPLHAGGIRHNARAALTLGRLLLHLPWEGRDFSNRSLSSTPGSMTAGSLWTPSLRLLLRHFSSVKVAGSRSKSRGGDLVVARFFKHRQSVLAIGGGLLFFLFRSVITFCWGRKCVGIRPARCWERTFAEAIIVLLLSEGWQENRLIAWVAWPPPTAMRSLFVAPELTETFQTLTGWSEKPSFGRFSLAQGRDDVRIKIMRAAQR